MGERKETALRFFIKATVKAAASGLDPTNGALLKLVYT
jgi:hypothetical protein